MSMILGLIALGDANISRVLADPPLVWRVMAAEDPEPHEDEHAPVAKTSWLGRIFGRAPAAGSPQSGTPRLPFVLAEGEGSSTDLDKAWHGMHYLLTKTAGEGHAPLNFLMAGGRQVGKIDVGYGPARVLSAAETQAAHAALMLIDDEGLRARFDPEDMTAKEIYPEIWDRDPAEDDALDYLLEYAGILRAFLAQVVERKQGLVVYLT